MFVEGLAIVRAHNHWVLDLTVLVDRVRVRRMTEAQIEDSSPPELANLPDGFWNDAELVAVATKEAISLRVDEDALSWFRGRAAVSESNDRGAALLCPVDEEKAVHATDSDQQGEV